MKRPYCPSLALQELNVAGNCPLRFDLEGRGPMLSDDVAAWLTTRPEARSWTWEEALPPSLGDPPRSDPEEEESSLPPPSVAPVRRGRKKSE